jgi:hypothetical protein
MGKRVADLAIYLLALAAALLLGLLTGGMR